MRGVDRSDGSVVGYVVQPVLPAETLAPAILARSNPAAGHPLVEALVDTAAETVSNRLGLDAQLANWAWDDGGLRYIDVSTPMTWDDAGNSPARPPAPRRGVSRQSCARRCAAGSPPASSTATATSARSTST